MDIIELKEQLVKGTVEFSYKKKDGSVRKAKGTLKSELIPEDSLPKNSKYEAPENVQRYYDVDANGWRSFLIENLVS